MADTGKQSPLGQNVLGGMIKNDCIRINPNAAAYMGASKTNDQYTPGILVNNTVLRLITWAINWGWETKGSRLTNSTYNNIIDIKGNGGVCEALGNAKPPTYYPQDPSGAWAGVAIGGTLGPDGFPVKAIEYASNQGISGARPGPANAWYSTAGVTDQAQSATWWPYNTTNANNEITKWGWIRCHALQAWCEFNYHGRYPTAPEPKYEDFASSFLTAQGFINYQNQVITSALNAERFLEGTFSNINDLITSDFSGVNLAFVQFGQDLTNLGKLFDPRKLDKFGFPSTLLQIIYENGAMIQDLNVALAGAGLSAKEITSISNGTAPYVTSAQEKKIYSAFLIITKTNLVNILAPLEVNNPASRVLNLGSANDDGKKFRTLADCLDVRRLFPESRQSMTVPIYNTTLYLETGSKTYYLIYNANGSVNTALSSNAVKLNVGTLFTQGTPPVFDDVSTIDASLPMGFDSYLGGPNVVVPTAVGLAAGAFRYAMLQINNITSIAPGKIGRIVSKLELQAPVENTSTGPNESAKLLSRPINSEMQQYIKTQMAIGSGPYGTYTYSDFFGCMSGLPYAWARIKEKIDETGASQNVSKSRLNKIYEQLYLTVTWEHAFYNIATDPFFRSYYSTPYWRNPPNPKFDDREEIPNPDWDPADPESPEFIPNPDFDDRPYLNNRAGSLDGAGYREPTYYKYTWRADSLYYRVGIEQEADGGGYGRGNYGRTPTVKIYPNKCNAKVTVNSIGTNNADARPFTQVGGIHPDPFGRVTSDSISNGNPYKWKNFHVTYPPSYEEPPYEELVWQYIRANCPQESITTQCAPTGSYDAYYRSSSNNNGYSYITPIGGGKGTQSATPLPGSGWGSPAPFWTSPGNSVAQNYINQANNEIPDIKKEFPDVVKELNIAWDVLGRQLKVEQRARYIGLGPVEIPRDPFVSSLETLAIFVDSLPSLAQDTLPHMSAQTIEMIVDRDCILGKSALVMMRQERNQIRLGELGIPMNNNIPVVPNNTVLTTLAINGTTSTATEGIEINGKTWTNPSWPYNPGPGLPPAPIPGSRYNPPTVEGGTPIDGNGYEPIIIDVPNPQVGDKVLAGPFYPIDRGPNDPGDPENDIPIVRAPPSFGPEDGGPNNTLPSQPSVADAIEQVISCNCDCWDILGQ